MDFDTVFLFRRKKVYVMLYFGISSKNTIVLDHVQNEIPGVYNKDEKSIYNFKKPAPYLRLQGLILPDSASSSLPVSIVSC